MNEPSEIPLNNGTPLPSFNQKRRFVMKRIGVCLAFLSMLTCFALAPWPQAQSIATTQTVYAQSPGSDDAVVHNTWTTGVTMPTAVNTPATGVLSGKIYVVGGGLTSGGSQPTDINQVYDPSARTWGTGAPLPSPTIAAVGAVVKGVLYVIGGTANAAEASNAVLAYSPKTRKWSTKSSMLTGVWGAGVAVYDGIIYVIGGQETGGVVATSVVQSYDPATDSWEYDNPLLNPKTQFAAGALGTTILASDGLASGYAATGDNEGYDITTNVWSSLPPDPTPRLGPCGGAIGGFMYVAGGYTSPSLPATTLTESFRLSREIWRTPLAPTSFCYVGASG